MKVDLNLIKSFPHVRILGYKSPQFVALREMNLCAVNNQ